jgi:hypothetical protein
MSRFGFKIVDRYRAEIQPILEKAIHHHPVKFGFYFHNLEASKAIWQFLQPSKLVVNTHLKHFHLHNHRGIFDDHLLLKAKTKN